MQVVMSDLFGQIIIIVTEGRQLLIGNIRKHILSVCFNCWLFFKQDHEGNLVGQSSGVYYEDI